MQDLLQQEQELFTERHKSVRCCGCYEGDLGNSFPEADQELKDWLRSHDKRVLAKVRALVNEKTKEKGFWLGDDYHDEAVMRLFDDLLKELHEQNN